MADNMGPSIADLVYQFLALPEEKQREVSALMKTATEKKKTSAEASVKAKESGERLPGPTSRRQLGSLPEVQSLKPVQASASAKNLAKGSQADADSRRRAGSRGETKVSKPTSGQKRKAKEAALSTSAGSLEPAPRRQATEQPLEAQSGPETMDAQDSSVGEQSTKCARQHGYTGVEVANAGVVAGQLAPNKKSLVDGHPSASNQPSGSSTPSAKAAAQSVPVDSMESTNRRPAGPGERKNKTPVYVTGVSNTRSFLRWLQGKTGGNGTAQIRGESLVLVPDTADCFRATITALRSIEKGKDVSFHTYSLPEDRTVRLLVKNLGRKMPESDVREELEVLGITVMSVLQLRSHRRTTDTAKDRPLTPHFIVTVCQEGQW